MLNIISRSIVSAHNRGPRKVVMNLLKGLDEIGYPYVVNKALNSTNQLWIHDDPLAVIAASKLPPKVKKVAGPNIYTVPAQIHDSINPKQYTWIHPSSWVEDFWNQGNSNPLPSVVWPVGIDTEKFVPSTNIEDIVLVYNKQRSENEVQKVCAGLKECGEKYEVITYGSYKESDYQALLERAKAIIWVGRSESQGVGLLEALASDVPALVCDVTSFGQWSGSGHTSFTPEQLAFTPVTAAPYFNEQCGMKITTLDNFTTDVQSFLDTIEHYQPRKYIEATLTLTIQARAFISIYKTQHQVSDVDLLDTTLHSKGTWRNGTLSYRIGSKLKDAVRQVIR